MSNKELFLEKYNEVFDEDDNIKCCGRNKCIELIEAAQDFLRSDNCIGIPLENLGSTQTGVLNKNNIFALHDYIVNNI